MKPDTMNIFYQQSHENLRLIERHIMQSKLLVNQLVEYHNETIRDQLTNTLEIAMDLTNWILENANNLQLDGENP